MVVDGSVGYARVAGNVADGGAGEAALGEEAQGGVEDLLARVRSAPRAAVAGGVFCGYGEGPPIKQPLRQLL